MAAQGRRRRQPGADTTLGQTGGKREDHRRGVCPTFGRYVRFGLGKSMRIPEQSVPPNPARKEDAARQITE